ncbi:hypothetical protein Lpp228_02164 [Lacticaseibacillus paracasei subsp. paracasei Lpp228]|uniref:Uncharacterized protein n=1 Tax=Lacticaseibacillus paracasei subsp. paracasei Lpp49 TaxID=1256213 RepID=A0ABC9TGB8_LACPA|nr:hypothetical protein Lpp189_01267 [Lacticaseibacillus paracasei subsp. paracasei Lpp189]EPC68662.1 hypothetical protein Lpp228_02164 [Lacticaseibacillus paracasei subsp. paracasei Lpp228]EPC82105.1 hypothetical protein Lpp37_09786 [Lacticaseibacillus paracasei subsp. paracasei Lpp37]EPC92660.1 hypothetical protein Lpp49_00405 [Lacticaseibacillus paracasei subsp. paracasei Lpp49]EPD00455.1 hypothetical protein Lpp125_09319 [Lacticaseibacillus paracasei subsp. paracasei Lpp125]EPD12117.1 hypo
MAIVFCNGVIVISPKISIGSAHKRDNLYLFIIYFPIPIVLL